MRTYVHDEQKIQELFAGIVSRLSGGGAHTEMINGLLKDVCEHFRFGCGLIYESDHTETFHLKEQYSAYPNEDVIRPDLRLEAHLTPEEIDQLKREHILIIQPEVDASYHSNTLTQLFSANSLLLAPVMVGHDKVVGLVAMFDRRREILINTASVDAAKTVLKLLANHVKTRIIQRRLNYAKRSLNSIMDHMGIDIYVNDFDTHEILYLNQSMAAPYGGLEAMLGRKCWEALYHDKTGECDFCPRPKLIDEEGRPSKLYSWDYQRPFDGSWFRVFSAAFPWTDGRLAHVISSVDITENKRNEELINRLAFFDQLTKLPNRRKLVLDFDRSLEKISVDKGHAWVLFFDLDNFKAVNDTMGHQAGDDLLSQIGQLMEESPETKGRCYRLGGDEFVLVYLNESREFINNIIDFLLERFNQPWELPTGRPICRASIGVAYYPTDGADAEALLYQADMAMYQAKEAGKGQAVFTGGEVYCLKGSACLIDDRPESGLGRGLDPARDTTAVPVKARSGPMGPKK